MSAELWKLITQKGFSLNTADGGKTWCVRGSHKNHGSFQYREGVDEVPRSKLAATIKRMARK